MIKVGNRYKVKYGDWISDCTYEVIKVIVKGKSYIIGIDGKSASKDRWQISGWGDKEYEIESGMRYNRFWCVDKSELVRYCKNMEIE